MLHSQVPLLLKHLAHVLDLPSQLLVVDLPLLPLEDPKPCLILVGNTTELTILK
jgi:hypothetical protein